MANSKVIELSDNRKLDLDEKIDFLTIIASTNNYAALKLKELIKVRSEIYGDNVDG